MANDWRAESKQSLAKASQNKSSIGADQQRGGGNSGWMCGRSMEESGANRANLTNSTALQLLGDILSKKKVDSALVALDEVIGDDIFSSTGYCQPA